MTTISESNSTKYLVSAYLKKCKLQYGAAYENLILFGVKPNDIIKFIERPEACGNWPLDFVYQITITIDKISKYCLIVSPKIEAQTEEDRVLSKLLSKSSILPYGTNTFFGQAVKVQHVIAYMQRDEKIHSWNADFLLRTQQEVERVKEFLL